MIICQILKVCIMKFNVVEFFVGAGGSHLGFMQNGFNTLYVNDNDIEALKTLKYNNAMHLQNAIIDSSDITKIDPQELRKSIKDDIDVCFAGIVCKGFSLAGEKNPNDERNFYYKSYLSIIKELQPRISIIENVKGMLNARILNSKTPKNILEEVDILWQEMENYKGRKADFRKKNVITQEFENYGKELRIKKQKVLQKIEKYMISVLEDIIDIYNEIGYRVDYKILNAAWYGSSTKRERLIIVATRKDIKNSYEFPKPIYHNDEIVTKLDFDNIQNMKFKQPISIRESLSKIDYLKEDFDNEPMKHNEKTIERFQYIKAGSNISECIDELPQELRISKFYSRGNTMRLHFDKLAPTLVPGHSNFPIHPIEHRSITVREAAVITGFPLDYKFFGSHSKRCEQVGNAVPPPLSYAIAKSVKNFLETLK